MTIKTITESDNIVVVTLDNGFVVNVKKDQYEAWVIKNGMLWFDTRDWEDDIETPTNCVDIKDYWQRHPEIGIHLYMYMNIVHADELRIYREAV